MQFKGKPTGAFRDDARWNAGRKTVDFGLDVHDDDGSRLVVCRVAWEALSDASSNSEPNSAEQALELYGTLKSRVQATIDRKLKAGEFEEDDSIVIARSDEL